ncbi:hypothetical protein L486_00367 [Kwoniella mangroviensis CBS 10435]|uniref:Uncharacterized protein n=1 Tax=Kwoniella mangroviensis CBS 10435 TaxID=1331196 RepID=A0A1B9IYW5_9TREE|nr:uncharacterized protein I203_06312 [Kwoniella mangroviensis CBS 8507]OCF60728.1 hypothetical protein L486_00367 [Kwoniella mangroviensis CBS 10435]OCF64580.1 hypothetical protein I203_06312 [Kwoniella mangroviensis CBS 8507]
MTNQTPLPTYAKVLSLSQWITYFHPTEGIFRSPSDQGESIEHLDIDLRYVEHDYHQPLITKPAKNNDELLLPSGYKDINLPRVVVLTLRGGEYVQDDESRMESLAEVLMAINPVEVHWVNAATDPSEQLTFATHLVHPAIIAAGQVWSRNGSLRKLFVQGGFPVPNLTAPTPFSLTPAATPCPSPGPTRSTFGALTMSHSNPASPATSKFPSSGLPALSTTKPKLVDEERLKARAERQRLAEYTLKPRFEYAFGGWTVDELRWRLDGRYTPACKLSIITHIFRAFGTSFPSSSRKVDIDLPSMIIFTTVPRGLINDLVELPSKLELDDEVKLYLQDVTFVSIDKSHCPAARLFDTGMEVSEDRERQSRCIKSEMILLHSGSRLEFDLVSLEELREVNKPTLHLPQQGVSPAVSDSSILPDDTEGPTEDEGEEAITPEMGSSPIVDPSDRLATENNKGEPIVNPSLSNSLVL